MTQEEQLREYILGLPPEEDGCIMNLMDEHGNVLTFTIYELKAIFNAKKLIEASKEGE